MTKMAKKPAKKNISIRLQPCTLEFLRDMTQYRYTELADKIEIDSIRKFLEVSINHFIYYILKPELMEQLLQSNKSHEQLCNLWLKYRRAKRGEKGYKIYRCTKKDGAEAVDKIVAIFGPEDNDSYNTKKQENKPIS